MGQQSKAKKRRREDRQWEVYSNVSSCFDIAHGAKRAPNHRIKKHGEGVPNGAGLVTCTTADLSSHKEAMLERAHFHSLEDVVVGNSSPMNWCKSCPLGEYRYYNLTITGVDESTATVNYYTRLA